MTGLISGPPVDSVAEEAAGLDLVPTTPGRVLGATFGQAFDDNITFRGLRDMGRSVGDILWTPTVYEPPTTMEPAEAQAKYPGIKVMSPVTEGVAEALFKAHQDEQRRSDIIARSDGSILSSAPSRFVVGMAAGLLDPLNIAAGLVPVFGEGRVGMMLARAGGMGERAAVRAAVGLGEGAVGMAALEPLQYGMDRFEGNDWTMGDAVHRIAIGAALGSVLHVGAGAVKDWRGGVYRRGSPLGETVERVDALDPEARGAAFEASVAAVAEGKPVKVDPVVKLAEDVGATTKAESRFGPTLLEFLANKGGLRDQGGELSAMDLQLWHRERPFRRRLVHDDVADNPGAALFDAGPKDGRRSGPMTLDDAALAASEAGYIGRNGERADINDLLDAMRREASGEPVYPPEVQAKWEARKVAEREAEASDALVGAREDVRNLADEHDIRLTPEELDDASRRVILDGLSPESAIVEAQRATHLDFIADQDRLAGAADAMRDIRDQATAPFMSADDVAAMRAGVETLARAPKAEGAVDAQAAELARLYDNVRAQVEAEVKAGRMTEADLAVLEDADARAALIESDGKAAEAAAACMVTRGGL